MLTLLFAATALTPGNMPAEGATAVDDSVQINVNIDNMLKVAPVTRPDFTKDELPKLRAAQAAEAAAEAKEKADAEAKAQADALAAEQAASAQVYYSAPAVSSSGNGYDWGQCTWYVKNRRPDIPNNWGNAGSWFYNAQAQGWATGYQPRAGAIGTEGGHVVYIESVNGDGTVNISEMNWNGGVGQVHYRTAASSDFAYIY